MLAKPGFMHNLFSICGHNVSKGKDLKKEVTPVEADEVLAFKAIQLKLFNEVVISDMAQGRSGSVIKDVDVMCACKGPKVGEPTWGSKVAKSAVVSSIGGFSKAKFQFQSLHSGAEESACNG